jgi:membrane glycosyltransferase
VLVFRLREGRLEAVHASFPTWFFMLFNSLIVVLAQLIRPKDALIHLFPYWPNSLNQSSKILNEE